MLGVFCMKGENGMLKDKKLFLLDMDGTLYLGDQLFDGTIDFLKKIREKGGQYLFLTNNSSKSATAYVQKLSRLGIAAVEEDFFTSTNATTELLKSEYPGVLFYAMGTGSFVKELRENGIAITEEICDEIGGVILSNDQELTFQKLHDVSYLLLTKKDIPYLATNPDWVCPTEFGSVPDCGAFAQMFEHVAKRLPRFIGKPQPEMIYAAMDKLGYTKEETVMVGDRIYTDIASGYRAGVDTVFVLSGEGTMEDAERSAEKPTYIEQNVRTLLSRI